MDKAKGYTCEYCNVKWFAHPDDPKGHCCVQCDYPGVRNDFSDEEFEAIRVG